MEAIEQETLTPSVEDVFTPQEKRKIFLNKSAMCDYMSMIDCNAGNFRSGYMEDGSFVWELVYISNQE